MRLTSLEPTVEISTSSGVLGVTICPSRPWAIIALEVGVLTLFAFLAYEGWARMSPRLRMFYALLVFCGAAGLAFQGTGFEVIEIDSEKITLRKGVRGWERKREYKIKEWQELEWVQGSEDVSQGLRCKSGWRSINFASGITETQSIQILTALLW
jgi:hypothetical protein